MTKTRKITILSAMLAVLLTMLACTIFIGGPDYPGRTVPQSTEALDQFQTSVAQSAADGASSGQMTLTITEDQLTSYLAMKLQQQTKPWLTNPQVYLQDGQVQIYGTAKQDFLQATAAIVLTLGIDENGQLKIELTSADFGPLPVPTGLLDAITAMVQEAFTGSIGPAATGIRLTSVVVANGAMTITGQTK
jgi:uncharacterized protein YpmS